MNANRFKAVILDMDGVITQTAAVHARAWKQMFDEFLESREGTAYRPFDLEDDYRPYVDGKPRYDGVQSFLESREIELPRGDENDDPGAETICGLGNRKNELFHEFLKRDSVRVYEDAVQQIDRWKREGLKVAVISSSRNCEAVLKSAGLLDRFDARIDGNDLSQFDLAGKPAPDMFLQAARELGVEPGETIVIEDAIAGVQAGRRGNFGLVVGIARNGNADRLREAGADKVVHDLGELGRESQTSAQGDPPWALEQISRLTGPIDGKKPALFLDYDGTLTPIVDRPEDATLTDEMQSILSELARECPVVIVSGRDRRNVENMVGVDELVYAGSHGFDIRGPGGLEMQQHEAQDALPDLDAAEQELRPQIERINRAHVERKKFAIAVHYRQVESDAEIRDVEDFVDRVVGKHGGLRKRGGKKIFELQPDVEWDKGRAVLWLIEALGFDGSKTLPIYIGDDETDEDAFRALDETGQGIGIRVAEDVSSTRAHYQLRDCDEVREFLQSLLQILKETTRAES